MDANMLPYWLTVTTVAVFYPVTSQSEFTTRVGGGAGGGSQCIWSIVWIFWGTNVFGCALNKQLSQHVMLFRGLFSAVSALKLLFFYSFIKPSLALLPLFYPCVKTLHSVCSLNWSAVCSSDAAFLSGGDPRFVSLCIKPNWLKIWNKRDTAENSKRFVQFIWWSVCSFPSLRLISPPLSQWGLTSLLRETTVISRVVCVCLNVRVC